MASSDCLGLVVCLGWLFGWAGLAVWADCRRCLGGSDVGRSSMGPGVQVVLSLREVPMSTSASISSGWPRSTKNTDGTLPSVQNERQRAVWFLVLVDTDGLSAVVTGARLCLT